MRVTAKLFLAGLVTMALAASAGAQEDDSELVSGHYVADPAHSTIHFITNHLGLSTFVGRFDEFDTSLNFRADNPEDSELSVTVYPDSIDANNDMFTQHLSSSDFFNVKKYPEVTFRATDIDVTGEGTGRITGDLTMLGETHPVTMKAELVGSGTALGSDAPAIGFEARTTIERSKWGMNAFIEQGIPDEVELWIKAEFHRQGDLGDM